MNTTNPVRIAALVLLVAACGRSHGSGSGAPPAPAEAAPSPTAGTSKSGRGGGVTPTVSPTRAASPTPSPTPSRAQGCRSGCEDILAAFLARNGGRHPFRRSLLPGAPIAGHLVVTPSESNPRRGVFGFDSSVLLELPFTTGTYTLQGEYLALFSNPQNVDANEVPLLFHQSFVGPQADEILSHVYVIDPTRKHFPLFVYP